MRIGSGWGLMGSTLSPNGTFPLLRFIGIYALGILAVGITTAAFEPLLTFICYWFVGLIVTRVVMHNLEYRVGEGLDNVIKAKWKVLTFWPIAIPLVIGKLIFNRAL
jgi:hypothetical protein